MTPPRPQVDERARKREELAACHDLFDTPAGRAKLAAGYATTRPGAAPVDDPVHQAFLQNLADSDEAVDIVGAWLRRLGFAVRKGKLGLNAPTHASWRQYRDGGDLHVQHALVQGTQRMEVKGRKLRFTGLRDWPFREKTIIVCAQHAWDDAQPKPWWVFSLNEQATLVAALHARSNAGWDTRLVPDKRYGPDYTQLCYLAPLTQARFLPLAPAHDDDNLDTLLHWRS